MAKKEEEIISLNPWLDKEYKQGSPLFTREPGLEIDDLPERLGLLDDVTVKDSIEATKFIELADTPSDYGLDKQFPMSDGEGAISWAYPFWKPTGSSIYFRKRVAVGHSHPMVEFHVYKPQTKVQVRIGAKENPWVEWHSTDENNGFAAGIADAANKLFKINYDSPIGTASQLFLCLDAGNTRIGAYTASPQAPYHIKESACASTTYHPYAILAVESTDNAMIQVSAGTDAGIVFCDDNSNPPAGAVIYDHPNEQIEFIVGTNERMWLSSAGILKTDGTYIHNDSGASSSFRADAHDADAYFECREDGTIKWTIGFDYSDSLKFKISEGLPGTSSRFEITSGGAIQLPNANQVIQWTASAGGSGGLQYTDAGSAVRYALLFPGSDIVALVNRAANGTVELRANTSTAGVGGEVTVVTIEDTDITLANGIGFNLQEDITFTGATAQNLIKFPDNLVTALSFREATNSYLTFKTTNGSEAVIFGKTFSAITGSTIGNLTLADGSITDSSNAIDFGNEALSTTGTLSAGGTVVFSTASATNSMELGQVTDNQYAFIDLKGDSTYTDYGLRIIRGNTGANAVSQLIHRGTGNLEIQTSDVSSIVLKTGNVAAITINTSQQSEFAGNIGVGTAVLANVRMLAGGTLSTPGDAWGVHCNSTLEPADTATAFAFGANPTINAPDGESVSGAGLAVYDVSKTGTGTIANLYGLYIRALTATATNKWGIYIALSVNNYLASNLGIGQSSFGTNMTKGLALGTGVAPTTSPADCFQMYSADIAAGHAACHLRNENDTIIKLYQQALIADPAGQANDLDSEARTAINSMLDLLENNGLMANA